MKAFLIDCTGNSRPVEQAQSQHANSRPVDHAIAELGFIYLRPLLNGAVLHVRFRAGAVSRMALASALFVLADFRPERVLVEIAGRKAEVVDGFNYAVRRIERLAWAPSVCQTPPQGPDAGLRRLPLARLHSDRWGDSSLAEPDHGRSTPWESLC